VCRVENERPAGARTRMVEKESPAGSEIGRKRWGKGVGISLLLYKGAQTIIYTKTSSYRRRPALDELLLRRVRGRSRPLEVSGRASRDARRAEVRMTVLEASRRDVAADRERVAYRGRVECSCGRWESKSRVRYSGASAEGDAERTGAV
jgi:hypothetical protein